METLLKDVGFILLLLNIPFLLSFILALKKSSSIKITNKTKIGKIQNEISIDIDNSKDNNNRKDKNNSKNNRKS